MYIKVNLKDVPINNSALPVYPDFIQDDMTNLKYYSIDSFKSLLKLSDSTVRRLIKRHKNETSTRFFINFHGRYYLSLRIKMPVKKSKDLRKNYTLWLNTYEWKLFGAVNHSEGMTIVNIHKLATLYLKHLEEIYPNESFTFFYASHSNNSRNGYHFHFILDFNNIKLTSEILKKSLKFFNNNHKRFTYNAKIELYDASKGGISYICKEIKEIPDGYDLILSEFNN